MKLISFQERKQKTNQNYCQMNTASKTNEGFNVLQNATWRASLAEKKHSNFISLNECNYPHVHWSQTRKLWVVFLTNLTRKCHLLLLAFKKSNAN